MLTKLRLTNFKGFKDAELSLGALTVLVGTNASGKSNIRDAFRFLHGISREYNLAEIIGEGSSGGGFLRWFGIRGGTRDLVFRGKRSFAIEIFFSLKADGIQQEASYRIEIDPGIESERSDAVESPRVVFERLKISGQIDNIFEAHTASKSEFLDVKLRGKKINFDSLGNTFSNYQPSLPKVFSLLTSLFNEEIQFIRSDHQTAQTALSVLNSLHFLDLSPDSMRSPSVPGQTILDERGENLSSVLENICRDPRRKQALIAWLQELTPMDAKDFEFPRDFTGKVLLTLVEGNGQKVSAYSASDGTLRFLAMIAVLLGSEFPRFYFFEELDNGIHPTRLHLLVQFIEQKVSEGKIQIVATTHSPPLLRLLSPESLEFASLTYRLPDHPDARIQRILDIPDAGRLIEKGDLADLHESGWLESAMYFLDDEEASE